MILHRFPVDYQMDSQDCGPACLKIIAKYFGRFYSLQYLRGSTGSRNTRSVKTYMIMETVELIIKISITLFNAIALGFVLIMVSRWHRRMEDKLNEIREYTRRVSDRDDVIYMNQLQWLKSKLIEEERYEEAAKINKCIEDEYNKLKNRKRDYEA
mgnify:CR=1 FL=1